VLIKHSTAVTCHGRAAQTNPYEAEAAGRHDERTRVLVVLVVSNLSISIQTYLFETNTRHLGLKFRLHSKINT
jgi:hypothetical protein